VACAGAAFHVENAGAADVLDGTAGSDVGPWNATYPHVCPLDFGGVTTPGTYSVHAAGAMSRSFAVDTATDLYGPLIANALVFYLGQRDGADVDGSVLQRKPAHLHDRAARIYRVPAYRGEHLLHDLVRVGGPVDVEGGWFDAGDYVKFAGTTAFTVGVMLTALRDHPTLFAGGGPAFGSEARRGVTWLLKMYDDPRRQLFYQVGIGSGGSGIHADHDVWRLPEKDDGYQQPGRRYLAHRPVFRIGPSGTPVPPSLAGRMSAVFGLCAQRWAGSELASRCLRAGQHLYALAKTSHVGVQITSSPVGYYREDEWRDDMEWGALELYRGFRDPANPAPQHVQPRYFLRRASHWAHAYIRSPRHGGETLNLYDDAGIAHLDLAASIVADGDGGLEVTEADLLRDVRAQLDPRRSASMTDPFGFGAHTWDPVPHAFGLVSEGLAYDAFAGTTRYAGLARRQMHWALGSNAWGSSFVVGAGTTFPFCMQHQVANLVGSLDGSPPLLLGATVDGPNDYVPGKGFFGSAPACPPDGKDPFKPFDLPGWRYVDRVSSWSTVEPSLDYTVMSFLAFVSMADA
jgi:hypothetical protein